MVLLMLALIGTATTHTHTVTFSLDDFSAEVIDGETRLSYTAGQDAPVGHNRSPYLPWIYKEFDIPLNSTVSDIRIEAMTEPVTYLADIRLYPRFMPVPTSSFDSFNPDEVRKNVEKGIYPSAQVQGVGTRETKGQGKARFLFCPFRTSAGQDTVYFIKRISVSYECGTAKGLAPAPMAVSDASIATADSKLNAKIAYSKKLDNVIITVDSLKSAFLPLRDWKRKKGMHCELLTVEEISDLYSEEITVPHQIKRALHCLYRNYNLESVTIGGDGHIVPTFMGYSPISSQYQNGIPVRVTLRLVPTDYFYVCFDGHFYWNANENEFAGELEDNFSFEPSLSIGRIPSFSLISSSKMVNSAVDYEKSPHFSKPSFEFLGIAGKIDIYLTSYDGVKRCDGYVITDNMLRQYIRPYRNITETIYHPESLSETGDVSHFSAIMDELSKSPFFININSHGDKSNIQFITGITIYDYNIESLTLSNPLIVMASSCHTANFSPYPSDKTDIPNINILKMEGGYENIPKKVSCFGAAFLSSINNNGIAYFGNSREGIGSKNGILACTDLWHAQMWKDIFRDNVSKSLGEMLRDVKYNAANISYDYFGDRRILMSEHLLGDPDIVPYPGIPNEFTDLSISPVGNVLTLNPGKMNDHTIKIGYLKNNVVEYEDYPVSTPSKYVFKQSNFSIVINRKGYVPFVCDYDILTVRDFDTAYLQCVDVTRDLTITAPKVKIGENVTSLKPRIGDVIFEQGHTVIKANEVILGPGTEIWEGASLSIN